MREKLYVASRVSHARMWQLLRDAGHNVISTWIDEAGPGQTASMAGLWVRIAEEIAGCDRLVVYAEPPDFPLKGALVEVGMAIALGKPVTLCLPGVGVESPGCRPVGSWMLHPLVTRQDFVSVAMFGRWGTPDAQ